MDKQQTTVGKSLFFVFFKAILNEIEALQSNQIQSELFFSLIDNLYRFKTGMNIFF